MWGRVEHTVYAQFPNLKLNNVQEKIRPFEMENGCISIYNNIIF